MPQLPPIPAKRYFTISEVASLCDVKPHVLRYWEQEFVQLRPMKRRGNRRYYQHHELLMVRRIRSLLYDEGFTIQGARNQLRSHGTETVEPPVDDATTGACSDCGELDSPQFQLLKREGSASVSVSVEQIRHELLQIRSLLAL